MTRDKERKLIMMKGSIYQKELKIKMNIRLIAV